MRRVAITGIGLATPLGIGTEETWQGLLAGRSAVAEIRAYDASTLRSRLGAELSDFDPEQFANRRTLRSTTRNDQLALAGAALAAADAGLEVGEDAERAGLFAGSSKEVSNLPPVLEAVLATRTDGGEIDFARLGRDASSLFAPLFYVEGLQAASLFYISQAYGLKGANTYFAGTAEASAVAVGRGYRAIRRGEIDVALAGGFDDATSWWWMTKLDALGILTDRNDLGAAACRPFDRERTGAVVGEGAAFLVLEELERARARGATVYAEVAGLGNGYDPQKLLTPHPEGRGLAHAVKAALREAGAEPGAVGYIAAHGSGTKLGDATEARALRAVLGENGGPAGSSVKAATGDLIGGAGALNAAVAALAVHHGALPPTLNLEDPDPDCRFDWVAGGAREADVGLALAIARGLEGQNVALAIRRAG